LFNARLLNFRRCRPITPVMSLEPVLARIAQIESAFADPSSFAGATVAPATASPAGATSTTTSTAPTASAASAATSFASVLSSVLAPEADATSELLGTGSGDASDTDPVASGTAALQSVLSSLQGTTATSTLGSVASTAAAPASGNQAIVQIAESQVGQSEQPPGSNNGPAIAMYRSAAAGAAPGEPWCAQFASWVAQQAGTPIGDQGQGESAVSQVWSWAQQNGRAITNGPGVVPQPGDLIVFGDAHVGIVTGVQANGDIDTVEGNFDNKVSANVRGPDEATGYVDMSQPTA
jgi:hypothetical protein